MLEKPLFKKINRNDAVTDMVGTLLLLFIAIAIFSIVYIAVFSFDAPNREPTVNIVGKLNLENNSIIFEHHGGETMDLEYTSLELDIAGNVNDILDNPGSYKFYDINGDLGADSDGLWSIGEVLIYNHSYSLTNLNIKYNLIDLFSNSLNIVGIVQIGLTTSTENDPPDIPVLYYPNNNSIINNEYDITLKVNVTDPDGNNLDVRFYNASNDALIGEDTNIPSGGTASVTWSTLSADYDYTWYVDITDGLLYYNMSDNSEYWTFNISTLTPPSIEITSPNEGDEILQVDGTWTITWDYTAGDGPFNGIDLEYSLNNGGSWSDIYSNLPLSSSYLWDISENITDANSTECLIKATISYTLSDSDMSNNNFTIWGINPGPPRNVVLTQTGTIPIMDTADSSKLITGTQTNDSTYTTTQDDFYHTISEERSSGKWFGMIIYNISITTGTSSPYTLYIDAYNNDDEEINVYYNINGGAFNHLGFITNWADTDTYDSWILPGVSPGNIIQVRINDSYLDNKKSIINIDHIYIESSSSGGTQNNLLTWDNSTDDGIGADDVTHYSIYFSNDGGFNYDPTPHNIAADNSASYNYLDIGKGEFDGILWYYKIIAIDTYGSESTSVIVNET